MMAISPFHLIIVQDATRLGAAAQRMLQIEEHPMKMRIKISYTTIF